MLALALNDPAFGILYVAVIAVLTAGLVFSFGMPRRMLQIVQLIAVLALGFFAGIAVSGVRTDVSGTPPVNVTRPLGVAPAPSGDLAPPKTGPPDGQVAVNVFYSDDPRSPRTAERLLVRAGALIHIEGWAFDASANTACGAIDVAVDGKPVSRIKYGVPRPDVGAFYKDALHVPTGFVGSISTKGMGLGVHQVRVRCIELTTNLALPGKQPHEVVVSK